MMKSNKTVSLVYSWCHSYVPCQLIRPVRCTHAPYLDFVKGNFDIILFSVTQNVFNCFICIFWANCQNSDIHCKLLSWQKVCILWSEFWKRYHLFSTQLWQSFWVREHVWLENVGFRRRADTAQHFKYPQQTSVQWLWWTVCIIYFSWSHHTHTH